jgi:hypothetical protein
MTTSRQYILAEHARPYFPATPADISASIAIGEQFTHGEAIRMRGLDGPGIDTALPQPWVDAAFKRTGLWAPGNVVWSYRQEHGSPLFGIGVAVTAEGEQILKAMRNA